MAISQNTITILVFVLLDFILLIFCFYLLGKIKNLKDKMYTKDKIQGIVNSSILSGLFTSNLNVIIDNRIKQHDKDNTTTLIKDATDSPEDIIGPTDSTVEDTTEINEVKVEPTTKEITLPKPIMLYAGSYKTGSFRHVEPTPDDKTIYIITTSDKDATEGAITIDTNAFEKVSNTPEYLDNACIVSGNGSNLRVKQLGTVVKENNAWVIKDLIEVELY